MCADLPVLMQPPVTRTMVGDDRELVQVPVSPPVFVSCWELEPGDIERMQASGRVWLIVAGAHPVVSISAEMPFDLKTSENDEQ